MGCSGSRFEADDDTPPQTLSPFRRRFDEIRQRRNGRTVTKDDRLSSKQLLHDEVEDGHHSPSPSPSPSPTDAPYLEIRMSFSSPSDCEGVGSGKGQSSKPKMDATTEVPPLHHGSSTHENDHNDNNNNTMESDKPETSGYSSAKEKRREMKKDDKDGEAKEHEGKREEDESSACGDGVDDEEGDGHGEGEGGFRDRDDRMISPGSPSFREYFLSSAANAANRGSSDAGDGEDGSAWEKSKFTPSERKESSSGSSEGIVVKSMKKENKGRRFKNVLPKGKQGGKQGGVKKMWDVRSYYHPSRPSNHGKVDDQITL